MVGKLRDKMLNKEGNLLFYSFTPPKKNTEVERLELIANKQTERIKSLNVDAIILYDIQDESYRTNKERTFPYLETISPVEYSKAYLGNLNIPQIIYKSIANQNKDMFRKWLSENRDLESVVFVGASSSKQTDETKFSLSDAYDLRKEICSDLLLGGVTISERHAVKGDEHSRIHEKIKHGCDFFISQCVYNVHDSKNLLSDYYYYSLNHNIRLRDIIFTLSPCGSLKTLEFMKWLGIEVPRWLFNDLKHSKDILDSSIKNSIHIANELLEFAESKSIPIGFNIESISPKKEEIEAAVEILKGVEKITNNKKDVSHFSSILI